MTENKMFSQRVANIPVMRYCGFGCVYCAFQKFQKISNCQACRKNFNHTHLEVLQRKPPRTKEDEFLTVGLSGDVSFMPVPSFAKVLLYCGKHTSSTFLIQSKNPEYFLQFDKLNLIPYNVIIGTTLETNRNKEIWTLHDPLKKRIDYTDLSKAPEPYLRTTAMVQLLCRIAITIEPIMDFDLGEMVYLMGRIQPEFIYIGYNSKQKLKLPEPSLAKTQELIRKLRWAGYDVREKLLRKAWWEQ